VAEKQTRLGEPPPTRSASVFSEENGFVAHPYLVPGTVDAREFQTTLADAALAQNTLVVMPTGLGKTIVAALVIAERLRLKSGKAVILAPTKPLCLQHEETMKRLLRDADLVHAFTGEVTPARRAELWRQSVVVVSTPQTVRNDLIEGRYDLRDVGLVVFDEAHRAVGDYAYVEVGERLRSENPKSRILALTASPGATRERWNEVCKALGVELVEARRTASEDVAPYVQKVEPEIVLIPLTPVLRSLQQEFQAVLSEQEAKLRQMYAVQGERKFGLTKRELIQLIQSRGRGGQPGPPNWPVMLVAQKALYATICMEYIETQGLMPLKMFLDRMFEKPDPSRAEKSFMNEARVVKVHERLAKGIESSHPKVEILTKTLQEMVAKKPDALAIVFAQFRDTVADLGLRLEAAGLKVGKLIGQQTRGKVTGLKQADQAAVLKDFGARKFNVLLSTSVGEEGLDVPQVDVVVFYEAVPSEIRAVQRRGRTGRTVAGRVIVLVAQDTRDEAFLRSQTTKEEKMHRLIGRFSG
jgi:ERCC4-related helicase